MLVSSLHIYVYMEHQLIMVTGNQYQTWRIPASGVAHDGQAQWPEEDDNNGLRRPLIHDSVRIIGDKHNFHHHQQIQGQADRYCYYYKTLPPAEILPRNEALGGYIFVCNNDTMEEDLRRHLFGLPQKYKDSVRAITPGLPLFLYNYTGHQLHGVYQHGKTTSAEENPDSLLRYIGKFIHTPIKKKCKPLEEEAFRAILYHYHGPKFRMQLSVPEALALLDLFEEEEARGKDIVFISIEIVIPFMIQNGLTICHP